VRLVAYPWTRVIVGPLRGTAVRSNRAGVAVATASSDLLKTILDTTLRRRGYLVIDAPAGCQIEKE
jgi:hypothetical protein